MANLSADRAVPAHKSGSGWINHYGVKDGAVIYKGSFVFESGTDGYASPTGGGNLFLGVAQAAADNTGGADAAIDAETQVASIFKHAVTGASAATAKGAIAYATDNQTLTLTASSAYSAVGWIQEWVSGTTCWILAKSPGQPIS